MCHLSKIRCFKHSACGHIYIFHFFNHKQLNHNSEGISFVMLAVHEQVVVMSSFYSETLLLLCVHETFIKLHKNPFLKFSIILIEV